MYLEHFGLNEKPFNITPNPQFIFLSRNHKEVFAHLLYGLQSRCGFIEITGEVGAGKTTVLRTLFVQLEEEEFRLAFIFNPSLSAEELLHEICRELGIDTADKRGGHLLPLINNFLLDENAAGRTVVLVIDEAQNLAAPVLEQIRLLSNLETETDKLIQIILVGQPELAEVLSRTNLRQLNQRISIRYHLRPMDCDDSIAYIGHRVRIAGVEDKTLFTDSALKLIYRHSTGLPRLINILSDRALLAAYSEDRDIVDRIDVKTAIRELQQVNSHSGSGFSNNFMVRFGLYSLVSIAIVFLAFNVYKISGQPFVPPVVTAVPTAEVPKSIKSIDIDRLSQIREYFADLGESETFRQATIALTESWHAEFMGRLPSRFDSAQFMALLNQSGWQWTAYNGSFETLAILDTPVLLELTLPGVNGRRYLALTRLEDNRVSVVPPFNGQSQLTRGEVEALYGGKAFFIWKNYLEISYLSTLGTALADVREIQTMLQQAGDRELVASGIYDQETVQAVTRFQASRGIVQDGRVGPLTLLLLYQQSGHFNPPRLSQARQS